LGKQVFELSNHLGNVLATITDKKLQVSLNTSSTAYFEADVQTVQDYYAFGMQMPGRKLSGGYRYGFNGQEKSNDVIEGNFTAEYWEYDSRIGRRWNLDVVEKAWISGYATLGNNPVMMVDPDGADWKKGKGGTYTWTDGKGKAGGFWTERNKAGISTWYGTTKDDIQMDGGMSYVTVTSHKKHGLRFLPSSFNHTAEEAAQWKIDRSNFDKGNYSALLPSQISMYKRWHQANKDWRQISLGAVGIIAAPLVVMGAVETGAVSSAWQGSRWLFQQGVSESGLMKEGAKWLGRKYGRSFITEVGINFFQNGMDIKKMDAFDIFTNTLNPYRQCLKGRVLMGGVNSLVDINLFAGQGQRLSYLGNGKNFGQAGIDCSFSLFNEGMKYTFGTLGGGNANRDFVLDIITGNAGGQAQQAAGDKK
jgi:RHS repeat-associated protein